MPRTPVDSSNLRSVGYDPYSSILQIEFHHGGIYDYYRVPGAEYEGLMAATSKGRYHHRRIRTRYAYRQIQ